MRYFILQFTIEKIPLQVSPHFAKYKKYYISPKIIKVFENIIKVEITFPHPLYCYCLSYHKHT